MIRAVIFDCFGVIIHDALSGMCDTLLGDNPQATKEVWHWIDQANRGVMPADESSPNIAAIFGLSYADYRAQLSSQETKNQTLLDYIGALRPKYKTAMLSNAGIGSLERRFKENELDGYFDTVVVSASIRYAKPDPQAYIITAERLGVQPAECLLVDDRTDCCEGAAAVGMHTILYTDFASFRAHLEAALANS